MSVIMNDFLLTPGPQAVFDTAEANVLWNKGSLAIFDYGSIVASDATDSGSTPTTTLRIGLLMGKKTSGGKLYAWSPTATDGTQIVYGVLCVDLNMLNSNAVATDRVVGILIGGWVKNASILNLDNQARQQMRGRFWFDDDFAAPTKAHYPWRQELAKTTAYPVVAADSGTLFTNVGAVGGVTFTLPTLASGLSFGFLAVADFAITVASAAGDDMVTVNDASADSVAFSTAGDIMGGFVRVYSNVAGTKWYVEKLCPNAMTIST